MQRAIELAALGEGHVEPNPMVGCVVVRDGKRIAEGWHRRFGGAHAEIEALQVAGGKASGATMYVTLEPCCHQGKTAPCTQAIIQAGIRRVVVAQTDPFPQVGGKGIEQLKQAGIAVTVGVLGQAARRLNAPYRRLISKGRPWVLAKWAMSLDGKIASRTGHSQWISNEASRRVVHQLRGRMDAIMVGRGTAEKDDPRLTARPPGPRTATRIVIDSRAVLSLESRLVRSAGEAPVLLAVGPDANIDRRRRLTEAGCEVLVCSSRDYSGRLRQLLAELGRRRMTNLLVEGGGRLLGGMFDAKLVDEIHVFIAPKLVGGKQAPSPVAGLGLLQIPESASIVHPRVEVLDGDIHIAGRLGDPREDDACP